MGRNDLHREKRLGTRVALYARAWVEISPAGPPRSSVMVALYARAWVEIKDRGR